MVDADTQKTLGQRSREDRAQRDPAAPNPSVAVALFALSDSGFILSSDPSFSELFSVPPSLVAAGVSTRALFDWLEEQGDDAGARMAVVVESERATTGEIVADDGRIILWHRTRLGKGASSEQGTLFCFHEVGRERMGLQALRDAENWLHMFAVHTGGSVLELDASGRVLGTWSADGEILAVPEASLHGRTLGEALGEKYALEIERMIAGILATGEEASLEYSVDIADERRVFMMTATLLANETGGSAAISVLVRDVTEQTRMQMKLVQAERLASVGLLAAGVAHEINNPLTYMVLNFHRVRRGIRQLGDATGSVKGHRLASELEQCIDMMVEGAQRVQEIVRDLQRFSRSDRSDLREPIDVRTVLEFTLGLVSFEIERHARVVREFGAVPLVLANDGRLSQVFLNLILNAVQALPAPDPAEHEIRLVTATDEDGNAVVEVRDTGIGIPAPDMRKIFDPFYTTKPPNIGTGLGLSICHGIVQSFGGDIIAESKVGLGTVFRVVLPSVANADLGPLSAR